MSKARASIFFTCLLLAVACGSAIAQAPMPPSDPQCPAASGDASSASHLVIGQWRHVELARYIGGNKVQSQPFPGENIVRFNCDRTWSLVGPDFQSSGTYRWLSAERLEQKIVESKLPAQRGQASIKRIVVDARTLEMQVAQNPSETAQAMRVPSQGKQEPLAAIVVTRFERVAP